MLQLHAVRVWLGVNSTSTFMWNARWKHDVLDGASTGTLGLVHESGSMIGDILKMAVSF
jgi:hypothetical protein